VLAAGPAIDQRFLGATRFENQALPLLDPRTASAGANVNGFLGAGATGIKWRR